MSEVDKSILETFFLVFRKEDEEEMAKFESQNEDDHLVQTMRNWECTGTPL